MIFTAPDLLAAARGRLIRGPNRCFYCGTSCGAEFAAAEYVADSFTERNAVACPHSQCVCAGCVESMRSDLASVTLLDWREQRPKADSSRAGLQFRWFSWLLTERQALAATPAHRELLLAVCLSPPEPPFAICIADGNKHQLYRTPVNQSRERITVNCEGTRVDYQPDELRERIALTTRIVATTGKGSSSLARLMDPCADMGMVLQLANHDPPAAEMYDVWREVRCQPLSGLALWLTPGKEDARECLARTAAA